MQLFTEVDPAQIEDHRLGRRGRISYSIIKSFMESGMYCAKLNREEVSKKPEYLKTLLGGYVKRHDLPIRIFLAQGDVHLLRLDFDEDGNKIEDWKAYHGLEEGEEEEEEGEPNESDATPIHEEDPSARAAEEKRGKL